MKILAAISLLLNLGVVYFLFRIKTYYEDYSNRHKRTKTKLINRIENLRSSGNSDDADAADILRLELEKEIDEFKRVSDLYATACCWNHGADKKG
ncbi:hypothetical protein N9955_01055 [bacterium]|nr:hypothetical protein [bacterium]